MGNEREEVEHGISCKHAEGTASVLAPVVLPLLVQAQADEDALRDEDDRPGIRDPMTTRWITISAYVHALCGIVSLYQSVVSCVHGRAQSDAPISPGRGR